MPPLNDPHNKECPFCGEQHPIGAQFCPNTGESLRLPSLHCPNCGRELRPTWKICTACGYRLDGMLPTEPLPIPEGAVEKPRRSALFGEILIVSMVIAAFGAFLIFNKGQQDEVSLTSDQVEAGTPITSNLPEAAPINTPTPKEPTDTPVAELPAQTPSDTLRPTQINSPTPTLTPTSTPELTSTPTLAVTNPADQAVLIFIPAGEFTMGSDPDMDPYFWGAESPSHTVYLDEFWIYKTEVTNAMYQRCAAENACPLPDQPGSVISTEYYGNPEYDDYPVVYITYIDAVSYCGWAGGRLPTEAEWEKAARGTDRRLFPWGDEDPSGESANLCDSRCVASNPREADIDDGFPGPASVGSYPKGASPYGVLDMAGNVWEWVSDYFQSGYYNFSPYENPRGPVSGSTRVYRGGSWVNAFDGIRVVVRASMKPENSTNAVGFRCVVDQP